MDNEVIVGCGLGAPQRLPSDAAGCDAPSSPEALATFKTQENAVCVAMTFAKDESVVSA